MQTIISSTRRIELIDQEIQDLEQEIGDLESPENGKASEQDKLLKKELIEELEQEKKEMFQLIDSEKDAYQEKMLHLKDNQRAIVAYVLFKSEAWREKTLEVFKRVSCEQYLYKWNRFVYWLKTKVFTKLGCNCFGPPKQDDDPNDPKKFKGQDLNVYASVDP